jgi:hypothetical protein
VPQEEWFTAMQNHPHGPEVVLARVIRDPLGGLHGGSLVEGAWLADPALIGVFIHITVSTRKIATTMQFQYELAER